MEVENQHLSTTTTLMDTSHNQMLKIVDRCTLRNRIFVDALLIQ